MRSVLSFPEDASFCSLISRSRGEVSLRTGISPPSSSVGNRELLTDSVSRSLLGTESTELIVPRIEYREMDDASLSQGLQFCFACPIALDIDCVHREASTGWLAFMYHFWTLVRPREGIEWTSKRNFSPPDGGRKTAVFIEMEPRLAICSSSW